MLERLLSLDLGEELPLLLPGRRAAGSSPPYFPAMGLWWYGFAVATSQDQRPPRRFAIDGMSRWAVAAVVLVLSAGPVLPFFFLAAPAPGASRLQMPAAHDLPQHWVHTAAFAAGLRAGNPYPRWSAAVNRGFGAPTFNYYPPGYYYLGALFGALFRDPAVALLALQLAVRLAMALALWAYAREVLSPPAALVATASYLLFPYPLLDLYHRGALAELLSFVTMPLALLFAGRLLAAGPRARLQPAVLLAVVYGALLWCHPPTAYLFTLVAAPCLLALALVRRQHRALPALGGAGIWGLALGAAYLYPALAERQWIRPFVTTRWPYASTYVFWRAHHIPPEQRIFLTHVNSVWVLSTAVVVLCGLLLLAIRRWSESRRVAESIGFWVLLGSLASFLATPMAGTLGAERLPGLAFTNYAWRQLALVTLAGALLTGAVAERAREALRQRERQVGGALLAIVAGVLSTGAVASARLIRAPEIWAPPFVVPGGHQGYLDLNLIPRTAPRRLRQLPVNAPAAVVAGGQGSGVEGARLEIERWAPEQRDLRVELPAASLLRVRTFFFPGWRATVDGRPVAIEINQRLGNIVLPLPAGKHRVRLEFGLTPIRRAGTAVTLAALLAVLAALMAQARRLRL